MPFIKKIFYLKTPQKAFLFLIKELGYKQKEAQSLIARGRLLKDGIVITNSSKLISEEVEFIYFEPITKGLKPVFQADDFIVFDKPSGVLIHPQNRHSSYSLIDEVKFQYGRDANIAHRIDLETSGLVLCTKNKTSERILKMLFENRNIKKQYFALVFGNFKKSITCKEPLKIYKNSECGIVRSVVEVNKDGKKAQTDFRPIKYLKNLDMTIVECIPYTGRQHQIRVHLFHVKHSIVGDPLYGVDKNITEKYLNKKLSKDERIKYTSASRLLLHANTLAFKYKNKDYNIASLIDFEEIIFSNVNN